MSATESLLINLSSLTISSAASYHRFSHIPWLERCEKGVYKKSLLPGRVHIRDATEDKRNLVLAMGNAVPIFLPAKYHQMRCVIPKSTKLTAALREQWETAFEFVYSCGKFDHDYMAKDFLDILFLGKIMPLPELATFKSLKASRKAQLCQSAAEFLLEPWVLIQMPFQPALLHQWAVALLAETLTFQKKISPIFSCGCPQKFVEVADCLRYMAVIMENCAYTALQMYLYKCVNVQEMNITAALTKYMDVLSINLNKALPVIAFATSKEANGVIWAIEKLFLKELNGGGAHPPQVVIRDQPDDQPSPLYDFWFWTTKCELRAVFGELKRTKANSHLLFATSTEEHECSLECSCEDWMHVVVFVCERLLLTKRLAGVDLDTLTAVLKKQNITNNIIPHLDYVTHFMQDTNSTEGKTDDRVHGVLDDIICLYADVKMSENFDLLARRIFDMVKSVHPEVTMGSSIESGPATEHALPDVESKFEQIFANETWTWEKILTDAKSTCGALEEISPADIDHPEKVIQHFQTRIRKLAHKIAEKHLSSWKAGRFEFFPEQMFVQYLLPCFVNCFLSPLAIPSKNQTAMKRKCVKFVEKLICCYEQQEFSQILATSEKKMSIQNISSKIKSYCQDSPRKLFKGLLAKFLNFKEASRSIFPTITHFFDIFEADLLTPDDLESLFDINKWYIHIDMFLLRSVSILKDLNNCNDDWQTEAFFISECINYAFLLCDEFTDYLRAIYFKSLVKVTSNMIGSTDNRTDAMNAFTSVPPKEIAEAAKKLSCHQLAALIVFMHFGNLDTLQVASWKSLQGPAFPFDLTSVLIWCAATGDMWKIKQLVAPMLMIKVRRGKKTHDTSLVSLDFAKSNVCYKSVLTMISSDGSKVLMKEKGEITFVPVKHCRWCGLIKVEKFRLCSLCEENSDYCDVNYFCSEKCELEALASKHREEHARFFTVKLGFEQ